MAGSSKFQVADSAKEPGAGPRTSLLRSSPLFVLLAIVAASAENYANPDLWRQILSGRAIVWTWQPRLHDIYSYTAYGHPIRDHEWLAQAVMAMFYDAMGVRGLLALKLLCVGATIAFLAAALAETGASARIQRMVVIVAALALVPNMQFRPQLFTFAMLAFEMAILARETFRGPGRAVWLMVPGFALWVNLHGGYLAGLGAMGVFAAVTMLAGLRTSAGPRRGLALLGVTAVCALATLANPFGAHAWTNVLESVGDSTWHKAMVDWQPLLQMLANDWRISPGNALMDALIPLGIFGATGIFVALVPSTEDLGLVGVAIVFIAATFHTARFAPLAEIVAVAPLGYHASAFFARRTASTGAGAEDAGFSPVVTVILIVALAWIGGLFSGRLRMKAGFRYPAGAVAFMTEHGLHGNILSEFRWASYVMWHMSPGSRIFIDERAEIVYPDRILKDYIKFYQGRPGAERVLGEYPQKFVLVPPDSNAYAVVARNSNWKLIYRDNVASLFALAPSRAASDFPSPVRGKSPRVFFP